MKRIIIMAAFWLGMTSNSIAQGIGQKQHKLPMEQTQYSEAVEQQIKQVEQLAGLVKFKIAGMAPGTLTDRMVYHKVKGLSIAVVHNYELLWTKGYGWADEQEQRPVTRDTRFEPGSISKSINALGVLKLVQEGKLDPDTDINHYLRSWKFPYDSVAGNKKITTAHLLSHTAGLNVHGFPGYFQGDCLPGITQILSGQPPAHTEAVRSVTSPGLGFRYSGGGTMITEQMIMDISGQPYDDYMQQHILKPLGMNHSFFTQPPPENVLHTLATGYGPDGEPMRGKFPILPEQAAGGLWTTAADLAQYIIHVQHGLQGSNESILSAALTRRMLTPYGDGPTGLGVFIEQKNGVLYFSHGAANQGFRGIYMAGLEGGNGVVVLINSDNDALLNEVVNSVATVYQWPGMQLPAPVTKKVITLPAADLKKYTGTYVQGTAVVSLVLKDGILWYKAGDKIMRVYFTSPNRFFNLESETEKECYTDKEGRIKGFHRTNSGQDLGNLEKTEPVTLSREKLEQYAGCYLEPDGNKVHIKRSGDALFIDPGNGPMKMNFITEQVFYLAEDYGATYRFDVISDVEGITGRKGDQEQTMKKMK